MKNPPQDAWGFIVQRYQQTGVEQLCFELQDQGADVCLVLFAAWLEQQSVKCSVGYINQLHEQSELWQSKIIASIRNARINAKNLAASNSSLALWRQSLKELELQAERLYINHLQALVVNWDVSQHPQQWLKALLPNISIEQRLLLSGLKNVLLDADGTE